MVGLPKCSPLSFFKGQSPFCEMAETEMGAYRERDRASEIELLKRHTVHPTWIVFGVVSVLLGLSMLILMPMLLHAQRKLDCSALKAIGAVGVVVSIVIMALGGLALAFRAMQQDEGTPVQWYHICGKVAGGVFFVCLYALFALACVVAATVHIWSRSVPSYTLDYGGAGHWLSAPVSITRDASGVPHIFAANRLDALFGQGFVHAQDRLGQLESLRLLANGRLAEHLGEAALEFDKMTRAAGFRRAAEKSCALIANETLQVGKAYVAGINFFLSQEKVRPPEFSFMGPSYLITHDPEEFTIQDVCAIAKILQWEISYNFGFEMERWKLFAEAKLSYEELSELYTDFTNTTSIMSWRELNLTEADAIAGRQREAESYRLEKELFDTVMWRFRENESVATSANIPVQPLSQRLRQFLAPRKASNAWAARTAGSPAICASDPHLQGDIPSIWHESHLSFPGMDAAGVSMVGIPGILSGRTTYLAWGITMTLSDVWDFYVMQPDPARPSTHYMYKGQSLPFIERKEKVKVQSAEDITYTFYDTVLGPVVGDEWGMTNRHKIVVNASVLLTDPSTLDAFLSITSPNMRTVADFQAMLRNVLSPGLSIAITDINGTIGWGMSGYHPIRVKGHTGRIPSFGNGSYDHIGWKPMSSLPSKIDTNPATSAFFACANSRIAPDGYDYTFGYDWVPVFRTERIVSVLSSVNSTSLYSNIKFHRELQNDVYSSVWANVYRPQLYNNSTFSTAFRSRLTTDGIAWMDRMSLWNSLSSTGAQEPTFFWEWAIEVAKLPADTLRAMSYYSWQPELYAQRVAFNPSNRMIALCAKATQGGSCLDYIAACWNRVATHSRRRWGDDANILNMQNLIFGDSIVGCLFNRKAVKPGDRTCLNVADESATLLNEKMYVNQIPSMRQLFDWSTPNQHEFSLPGGNSGNPFSEFYDNLVDDYSKGVYRNVMYSGVAGDHQWLKP